MTEIIYTCEVQADLIQHVGSDAMIANAARVSTGQVGEYDDTKDAGLIRYLMRKKHGSPFEHNSMTFLVEAPIFVAREYMRHRMASYNEVSGRYSVLEPKFYVPAEDRMLVNAGSSANPKFEAGSDYQIMQTKNILEMSYESGWNGYKILVDGGIGNEVARMVLPLGIMTSFYVTCNARSLMAFLALRTSDAGVSNPQHEIELVAKKLEEQFAILFPKTYASFNEFGRVAP